MTLLMDRHLGIVRARRIPRGLKQPFQPIKTLPPGWIGAGFFERGTHALDEGPPVPPFCQRPWELGPGGIS